MGRQNVTRGEMFRAFLRNERGATALLFALMLPVLLAFLGAVVDYSDLVRKKGAMQAAADEAALAGAKVMTNSSSTGSQLQTAATTAATNAAKAKAPDATPAVNVSVSGYSGATASSVSVTLTYTKSLLFAAMFVGSTSSQIKAQAKATPGYQPSDCVIALDPSSNKAFAISGNGSVNIPNCGVHVNSSANIALEQKGASWLNAKSVSVVGNVSGNNITPTPKTGQPAITDPLASIPEPTTPTAPCKYISSTISIPTIFSAGDVFCGNTNFNADVTFSPGTYYFRGASVTTGNNVNISGTGVLLYFDVSSTLYSSTSGQVSLSALTSGPYAGIVIFGSRLATTIPLFHFTGGSSYFVNGTIYVPNGRFEFYGNSSLAVKSGYVIAKQFFYQGNSSFTMDTFGGAAPSALAPKNMVLTQ